MEYNAMDVIKLLGFSEETLLFRYSKPKYIEKTKEGRVVIKANPHPIEIIDDHYDTNELTNAYKIGSGLGFCKTMHNYHKTPDRGCVSVKVKDIIKQGGRIYKEMSSSTPDAWFVILPEKMVEVEILNR